MRIACVLNDKPFRLKTPEYDSEYVTRLFDGIARFLPEFEFVCLYGSKWPGWWSKLQLFSPEVRGDLLYFDLDTVISGPIDDLLKVGRLTVLSDFNRLERMASGVMFLPEKERGRIWSTWIDNPEGHIAKWGSQGDQGFLSQFWEVENPWLRADRWQDTLPGQIVSFKVHCKDGLPDDAKAVCFHGHPRPREVNWKV